MSIQHVGAVLYHMPELRERACAFALMAIADSADRGSGWTFQVTMREIAAAARCSLSTAHRAVAELERRAYLRQEGRNGKTPRYRVLFGFDGKRMPEKDLYATPVKTTGVKKGPLSPATAPPVTMTPPPVNISSPPNNPLMGVSVSYPDIIRKSVKNARPKKIPREEAAPDYSAEKQRQAAAIRAKLAAA